MLKPTGKPDNNYNNENNYNNYNIIYDNTKH